MIRSAWQVLQARWSRLAAIGVASAAAAGVVFATVTSLNGWLFGYAFFDEPAPTPTADTVAVVCLWAMALLAVVLAVVVYGAMVLVAADDIGAGDALRIASRRAVTDWWRAIPAMAVTVVLIAFVLPCVVAAPIIGSATPRITRRQVARDHVGRTIPHHAAISLIAGAVAASAWGVSAVAALLTGDDPAPVPWLVALVVTASLGLAGALAAAAVAVCAVAVPDHATRLSPWPAPTPAAPSIGWGLDAPAPSTAPLPGPGVHTDTEQAARWWSGLVASDRSMLLLTIAGVVLLVAFGVTYVCNVLVMGDPGPDATAIDLARHESLVSDVTPWWLGTTLTLLTVALGLAILSWRARRR